MLKDRDNSRDEVLRTEKVGDAHVLTLVKANVVFRPYVILFDGRRILDAQTEDDGITLLRKTARHFRYTLKFYGEEMLTGKKD